jgi:hypothetical protein
MIKNKKPRKGTLIVMINKIEFSAKNLTSNAGILPLINYTKDTGIFQVIDTFLKFEKNSVEEIKMNHIKTLICGGFIGLDRLDRFLLIKNDPLVRECGINVRNPENISRFLNNFNFKTTQMFRNINFIVFKKLLKKKALKEIVIDIDSSAENVEGNQEGATKGYNPGHIGNKCYNILFAFCDELKAYITGFTRMGNAYTSNGAAEMIKEIVANIRNDVDNIIFRMDSGYFSEEILNVIEEANCQYVIKSKSYSALVKKLYGSSEIIWTKEEKTMKEFTEMEIKLDSWNISRRFVVTRITKPEEELNQQSLFEYDKYNHCFFATNTSLNQVETFKFYAKRGNSENYIRETKYDMNIGKLKMHSFWSNEAFFQIMMLVYNIFLLFKMDNTSTNEYRQQIKTFRLKYIYVAAKIVKTARQSIMKLCEDYLYKDIFKINIR